MLIGFLDPSLSMIDMLRSSFARQPDHFLEQLTPMGVLAPGSAHARPSAQPPIDIRGNFPAPMFAEWPSNISPTPLKVESEVLVSHFGIYLKLAHFPVKIGLIEGVGGVPPKFFLMES